MTIGWEQPYLWRTAPYWFGPVYPSEDKSTWKNKFENALDRAIAVRLTSKFLLENIKVLAWVEPGPDVSLLGNFVDNVRKPAWKLKKVSDESNFQNEIETWNPDVIFIPDAEDFEEKTIRTINDYLQGENAGIVGGGGVLYNNKPRIFSFREKMEFWAGFGVWFPPFANENIESGLENEHITNRTHYVTGKSPEWIDYNPNESLYYYDPIENSRFINIPSESLGQWEFPDENWPGVIVRYPDTLFEFTSASSFGLVDFRLYWAGRSVLFSDYLAQSAMQTYGRKDWITLARRAIYWAARKEPDLEPITLHVWRGEVV